MGTSDRARPLAVAFLAAVAGAAALVLALLAHAGAHLCGHHPSAHEHGALAGTVSGFAPHLGDADEGLCPAIVYAAAVAGALFAIAAGLLVAARAALPAVLAGAARSVASLRPGRLAGTLAALGALPLIAILAGDGFPDRSTAAFALAGLLAGALLSALGLYALACAVLRAAERFAIALAAAFRLRPGADAPWLARGFDVRRVRSTVLVRRARSRAPPVRLRSASSTS